MQKFSFDGRLLAKAIAATFEQRNTPLSILAPLALTPAFASDKMKQTQWKAFLHKNKLSADNLTLADIITMF